MDFKSMAGERFDELTDIYEAMIDWPKRLAGEEPFYRRVLADAHAQSVLDVACGTGRHAAMFHAWGLRVEGADLSPNMIRRARAAFGEPQGLRWVVRGFAEPAGVPSGSPAAFDAAVCVGNSLPLAPDMAAARQAIHRMFSCVRPGGVIIVQVLNLWRLEDGPCLWQKCLRTTLPLGDVVVLKGVHRSGSRGFVELVVMRPDGGPPLVCESLPLLGIEAAELAEAARRGGASDVKLFGDYHDRPYRREESVDLLMVARK
jgi:SAM-dependent methyltransferase